MAKGGTIMAGMTRGNPKNNWWILGAVVMMSGLMLVTARSSKNLLSPAQPMARADISTLAVGSKAPNFSVTTIDGQHYSSASLRGKVVILFAMFANCADCIPEGQVLSQVQHAYASKGVTVLGVDIVAGEPVALLQQYRSVGHITIPLAPYTDDIVRDYRLTQPDMTYIIGQDGTVKHKNPRALSYAEFQRELESLL
jgi:peroxiredoxin